MSVLFFILLSILPSISTTISTDILTLLAFKSAISSDPTNTLSTWSESSPSPCSFTGITCSSGNLITSLSLPNRSLSGYLPSELSLLSSLQTLDLSHNLLSGRIPSSLSLLTSLSYLDLSSNFFNSSLPPAIAGLPHLSGVLNLSFNRFSGHIPPEYGQLPVAVSLDLRGNSLSGEIPQVGSLVSQGPTAFAGNPDLCGFPLRNACGGRTEPDFVEPGTVSGSGLGVPVVQPVEEEVRQRRGNPAITVTVLAGVILAAVAFVIVLQWQFRKKRGTAEGKKSEKAGEVAAVEERREGRTGEIYVTVDEGFGLELEELLRASAYVVGKSKTGIVYKVVVGRGAAVAVRRLSEGEEGEGGEGDEWKKRRAFETEAMAIGGANHPNVVRLRAYYYAPDEKLLIYDYVSNGTLHSALHGNFDSLFA